MPTVVWFQHVAIPILGMGLGLVAMIGIYRTINRMLDRRHERALAEAGGTPREALRDLHQRLEELDSVAYRLQELEERVDFAERVLARSDPPRLEKKER